MRYQFTPRANTTQVDIERAKKACLKHGAKRVKVDFPQMDWGRGTNQPLTVRFSVEDDASAALIAEEYGTEEAFVWNMTEKHYA